MTSVALCLYGQMRTYKKCLPYLQKNIIDNLNPDIFIHTWDNQGSVSRKEEPYTDSPKNNKIDKKELEEVYSPKKIVVEEFKQPFYENLAGVSPPKSIKDHNKYVSSVLPLHYKINECNKLKQEYEKERGEKYDTVIVTRPDIAILTPIPDDILDNTNYLWELRGDRTKESEYLDDIFVVSSSTNIDYYASLFEQLENYWKEAVSSKGKEYPITSQELLYYHIVQSDIEIRRTNEYGRGEDWELIRYGMDVSFYEKDSIGQYLHILRQGDTGIHWQKNKIQRGIIILKQDGLSAFIRKTARYLYGRIQSK